ncbi:TANGO2 [Branchiostoma lanceolatum]|uniref:TANGO2 protein n=1 Tax=Branchiostoma lanceolatum TaxID=7740 RepID=A0A8J9Z2F8_BRALA|nr:TANGO2 [Branchiostoma lanceolatum]
MCIVFLKFDPHRKSGGYKIVMAANRDEFFNRPTKSAHFWGENPRVLSGVDMKPGKEGGTWVGMAENGRLSAITNILQSSPVRHAKGRGYLITDFLRGNQTPLAYLENLPEEGHGFNAFNLLTMDLSESASLAYYSNVSHDAPEILPPGQYVVSNSLLQTPLQKTIHGEKIFQELLQDKEEGDEDSFIRGLLKLLDNSVQFPNDPLVALEGTPLPEMVRDGFSAICVRTPKEANYGTRTNTVVLVDGDNHVTFVEKTLKVPVDVEKFEWEVNKFEFNVRQFY